MSQSTGYQLLHKGVQRWIWEQNWSELRAIQEEAIAPILAADCDVIISAATAAGKTEAAFLPACSRIAAAPPAGIGILYLSPLKALINDQFRRLESLCDRLALPLTPWHGDVLRSVKSKQKKNPAGIILITPESLESLLLNQAGWCSRAFSTLNYIIIDEFHAFLGTERGCQLQSLLHRVEFIIKRPIPRIALSATLGDIAQVAKYLRPASAEFPSCVIESNALQSDLKVQLRGYLEQINKDGKSTDTAFINITNDIYKILRGQSHLIFANSRQLCEKTAAALSDCCEKNGVPNEFFPHHGNLAKEIRESLEARFQETTLPTSAVCTMTLELGIDIGSVDTIAQITAPHSVASLRQRLGRSGRRGNPAILRLFIPEKEITADSLLSVRLRLETVQCIAMINLLLRKWFEPPPDNQYHLSTLVQQTLSVIGQYGGVRADQLWHLLCKTGAFSIVSQKLYARLLTALGEQNIITQMQDGQLVLGIGGERLVSRYDFYAAFQTPEEYRLEYQARVIGTIPVDSPLLTDQHIIFAGKRWIVLDINPEKKVIVLDKAPGGTAPVFAGEGQMVHDSVRQEMYSIYSGGNIPGYLDKTARALLSAGIEYFHARQLGDVYALQTGNAVHMLPWRGDSVVTTIAILLRRTGLSPSCYGGVINIPNCTLSDFYESVKKILSETPPASEELASCVPNTIVEKHDGLIPEKLRQVAYGKKFFDIDGAMEWLKACYCQQSNKKADP